MGEDGVGLDLADTIVKDGAHRAFADFSRSRRRDRPLGEPSLVDKYLAVDVPDPELVARLTRGAARPARGHARVALHRVLPPAGPATPRPGPLHPGVLRGHDMNHVIAGYGTTGPEEMALSADPRDGRHRRPLGPAAHEHRGLRVGDATDIVRRKAGGVRTPGAAPLIADAFRRGAACTGDFSEIDHLSWPTSRSPTSVRGSAFPC